MTGSKKISPVTKVQVLKTISYRVISSLIGFAVLFFATGSIKAGSIFSIAELVWKPILYFLHEKAWQVKEKRAIKKEV